MYRGARVLTKSAWQGSLTVCWAADHAWPWGSWMKAGRLTLAVSPLSEQPMPLWVCSQLRAKCSSGDHDEEELGAAVVRATPWCALI
mmetsp:Transcript_109241/g.304514  ORF Transcript_109241/g.304514 Transcript_109241/m.304514 type:complete len:87 (+) Transcript_109241:383-643(+)